jgi:hypothetical protein
VQERWPALPYGEWKDTRDTLHLWTQVVGKVKLALNPYENHWWHISLFMTARGLTTGPIPCNDMQGRVVEIQFDFVDHTLRIGASDGAGKVMPLIPRSLLDFCSSTCEAAVDLSRWDRETLERRVRGALWPQDCGFS